MLQSTYTYCKCADTLSNFVSKLLLVSILVLPTSAQVDFTFNADTAESSFQVSDPAFCEPPDKPGRTAWSGELLSNSSSTYTVYQPRPVVPLHASVGDNQVQQAIVILNVTTYSVECTVMIDRLEKSDVDNG